MCRTDLDDQAEALRALLAANVVVYWKNESELLSLPIGMSPADAVGGGFLPPVTTDGIPLVAGKAALALLPLQLRARMNPETCSAMIGFEGNRGGILVIWQRPQSEADPLSQAAMRLAVKALHGQFDLAADQCDAWRTGVRQMIGMAEVLPQGVIVVPAGNHPGYVNRVAATYLGLPPGETDAATLAQTLTQLASRATNAENLRDQVNAFINDGCDAAIAGLVWWFAAIPLALRVTLTPLDPGEARGWLWLLEDVTAAKQTEDEIRIAAVSFASQTGMLITDPRGVIVRVNPAFTRLTGYRADESIGKTPAFLQSGRHDPLFYQRIWDSLKEKSYWKGEIWNRRKNGQIYAEMLTITAVITSDRQITHYVGSFNDITEDKEAEAEIHRLAYYDPLTHLPNRRLLLDRLGQAIAGSSRSGRCCALLFLDLDKFKNLNDSLGHDAGDQLLVETTHRIQGLVREGDTVARLGGDEFVVILEELSTETAGASVQASHVGEKIRRAITIPYQLNGREFHTSGSIGVALFRGHDVSEEALLKHADLAMYQAKSAGRNTLRFFDPAMQVALDKRNALEVDLRLAQERGQFALHYQMQVHQDGRLFGAEALLRWTHPTYGSVSPGDFIPLAEETGLILPIGHWVLEAACAQLQRWSVAPATRVLQLAVNVSPRQFSQPDFAEQVSALIARSGIDPARLKLELTETGVLDNIEDAIQKMKSIRALGVGFSLDDFGTGFSSLAHLARLPLTQLKIDRSFVFNLPEGESDGVIVATIISMGKSLGMHVIAEGVETESQREYLARLGCHAFQGYLFSRPLPSDEFEAFVRRN